VIGGGVGDDGAVGGDGNNIFYMGTGGDIVANLTDGDDTIFGGSGSDVLTDLYGDDKIFGGEGDDNIGAGAGDDYLYAGQGDDDLYGGAGDDVFFFNNATGHNTIHDFAGAGTTDGAEEDLIDLSSFHITFDDLNIAAAGVNLFTITVDNVDDFQIDVTSIQAPGEDDFIL
jgi:Ca2+-binding RTX toxin-like protein